LFLPLTLRTFDDFLPGVTNENATEEQRFTAIRKALEHSRDTGEPVYGLSKIYRVKPPESETRFNLDQKCQVICLPGCVIEWNGPIGSSGIIYCGTPAAEPRRWRGGEIVVLNDVSGDVFVVDGSSVTIEDVAIREVRSGAAVRIRGNRTSVVNTQVVGEFGGTGVVIEKGTGHRLVDLRISVLADAIAVTDALGATQNVQIWGADCTSASGALLAIEASGAGIRNLLVSGFTGPGSSAPHATLIQIRASGTVEASLIRNVTLRDVAIVNNAPAKDGIEIISAANGSIPAVQDLTLENVEVTCSGRFETEGSAGSVLRVGGVGNAGVAGLSWFAGGARAAEADYDNRLVVLERVTDAVFSGLTFSGSRHPQPITVGTAVQCTNIAFTDVAVSATGAGPVVTMDRAHNCGWTRGIIRGSATALTPAIRFTNDAIGCYVQGTDLSGFGSNPLTRVQTGAATTRLQDNFGSVQRSAITLGVETSPSLSSGIITVTSSFVVVTTGGDLSQINGPAEGMPGEGDLLVLRASGPALTVTEAGNIRLNGVATSRVLDNAADTLTLMFDGTNWLEVAFSNNG
jgi:hypothetical protein